MASRASLAHRLYTGELSYDFVGKRTFWYKFSGVLLVLCLAVTLIRGLNLSIDFTGGSEFTVPTQVTATTVDDYRKVAQDTGLPDLGEVRVNTIGDGQVRIQTRALNAEEINQMTAALAQRAGLDTHAPPLAGAAHGHRTGGGGHARASANRANSRPRSS